MTDDAGQGIRDVTIGSPADDYAPLLRRTSLFSGFSEDALTVLAGRFSERTYSRGDVVWRAGDDGDELIVVASGHLDVWGVGPDGSEQLVGHVGAGECAGEMALVLDERRSATVTCGRAARVLVLLKPDFRQVVREDASMLVALTELLSQRAMSLARRRPVRGRPTVVGVVADAGVAGADLVASAIARLARDDMSCDVVHVRIGDRGVPLDSFLREGDPSLALPSRGGIPSEVDIASGDGPSGGELASVVDVLVRTIDEHVRLIVIELPTVPRAAVELAATVCEYVVQVSDKLLPPPQCDARVFQVVVGGHGVAAPVPLRCEPFVLPAPLDPASFGGQGKSLDLGPLCRRPPTWRVLGRLTRKLLGATVGVALGGGAAFGIAHVGVLLALDEAGIPVDLVAGTSMGSIVGIGYAGGLSGSDMSAVAGRFGNARSTLAALDFSLSGTGLMDGRRFVQTFAGLLPFETFDELVLPCSTVAMDIQSGERVVIGSGRLDEAFRASASIPLLFAPVQRAGHFLVDGAMVDPVPADVVREMGADFVLAVNVVPHLDRNVTTALSRASELVSRLNPLARRTGVAGAPHVLDIVMNSMQSTQHELGKFKSLSADVLIDVDLAKFTWVDFPRAAEIVKQGTVATEARFAEIQAGLRARLDAA